MELLYHNVIGGKVLLVIGGDDNYKDSSEEQGSFLSRWARRKISSQFSEEYLDGRNSFIFSWDKKHRSIHEEALLHYFNSDKKDEKFVLEEKGVEVPVTQVVPKQVCCVYVSLITCEILRHVILYLAILKNVYSFATISIYDFGHI